MTLSARPALVFVAAAAVAIVVPAGAWMASVGDVGEYFRYRMPPGQTLYIFSKLAGLTAASLLTTQIVLVLLKDVPGLAWSARQHAAFGLLAVAVLLAHVGLFIAAASVRSGSVEAGLLLPAFGHDAYRTGLSFGSLGLMVLAVVVPLGAVVRRAPKNRTVIKNTHRCGVAAVGLGILHALVVGSEKGSILFLAVGAAAVLAVAAWRWLGFRVGETSP